MKKSISKKAQISILIIIAIVLVFSLVLIFLLKGKSEIRDNEEEIIECEVDEDCVKVQTECCPCSMGGEEKCVPKEKEDSFREELSSCQDNLICTALYNCKIESCACVEGKCRG
ncbi:hypothetical protein HYV50_02415 [Candidatus Pacearchaeota archaeon]|nr:hypothetical protein [Candidatus Pacearchaeota archaeon]